MDKHKERLLKLLDLQKLLSEHYDENTYNVFVFGSFITKDFIEGKSDVDIAVFTSDVSDYFAIATTIKEFFDRFGIEQDIFYIDTSIVIPLFSAPLGSPIMLTDFYPDYLKEYKCQCDKALTECRKEVVA